MAKVPPKSNQPFATQSVTNDQENFSVTDSNAIKKIHSSQIQHKIQTHVTAVIVPHQQPPKKTWKKTQAPGSSSQPQLAKMQIIPQFQNFPTNKTSNQKPKQSVPGTARATLKNQMTVTSVQPKQISRNRSRESQRNESCENIPIEVRISKVQDKKQSIQYQPFLSQTKSIPSLISTRNFAQQKITQKPSQRQIIIGPNKRNKSKTSKALKQKNYKNIQNFSTIQSQGKNLVTSPGVCDEFSEEKKTKKKSMVKQQKTHRISKIMQDVDDKYHQMFTAFPSQLIESTDNLRKNTTKDKKVWTSKRIGKFIDPKEEPQSPATIKKTPDQKQPISPFSPVIPDEQVRRNPSLTYKKEIIFSSAGENFSVDEENSFGVTVQGKKAAQASILNTQNSRSSPKGSEKSRVSSIPAIQNSFMKMTLKQSMENSNSVKRSQLDVSRNSRSFSNSIARMTNRLSRGLSQYSNEPEIMRHSVTSNYSQRPSRGAKIQEPQPKMKSQCSLKNEGLRIKKKKGVQEIKMKNNKVVVKNEPIKNSNLVILNDDRSNLQLAQQESEVQQESQAFQVNAPENSLQGRKLSLRLSNLKQLSPSQLSMKITHIDLRNNRLSQLPDQICDLSELEELKLDYNFLTILPEGVNRLKGLEYLSASQNGLRSIPQNLVGSLKHLILNDNKITSIQSKIGALKNLQTLLLHNNYIVDVPSSLYRLDNLQQLGLDWFSYLHNDKIQFQTKVLKGMIKSDDVFEAEQSEEAQGHQKMINKFMDLCRFTQILQMKKYLEQRQQVLHKNPQQDDSEDGYYSHREIPLIMSKGVTSKKKRNLSQGQMDPLQGEKSVKISFVKFLMFFMAIPSVEQMIMRPIFPSKQRKLSHLIALQGHHYLLKDLLKQINQYTHNCLTESSSSIQSLQTENHFLNSIDRDFSTPLILALKNKRMAIVKELLEHPRICLKQCSMKYGTALHVALANEELKLALRVIKMLRNVKDFSPNQDFNRLDEEGNTPMHVLMRIFNVDPNIAGKILLILLKKGATFKLKNKMQHTPLHQALYYAQNEAIKFALDHNEKVGAQKEKRLPLFNFAEKGGKMEFTPLHYAVYSHNFQLLFMLLKSSEIIDHSALDSQGRRPIDLCNSISAIFKALRRELKKQQQRFLRDNIEGVNVEKLVNGNLTHFYNNHKAMKRNNFRVFNSSPKGQMNSFGQRHMSLQNQKLNFLEKHEVIKPKALPGAFNRKISVQQSLSKPNPLIGGLAFNKGKNQIKNYTVKKASIQISKIDMPMLTTRNMQQYTQQNLQSEPRGSHKVTSTTDQTFLRRKRSMDDLQFNSSMVSFETNLKSINQLKQEYESPKYNRYQILNSTMGDVTKEQDSMVARDLSSSESDAGQSDSKQLFDENVSEEDNYEENSHQSSHYSSNRQFRNSFMELQTSDADQTIKHILKLHKREGEMHQLDLLDKINDSLSGKIIPNLITPKSFIDKKFQKNRIDMPAQTTIGNCDDLEISDEESPIKEKKVYDIQEDQEKRLEPIHTSQSIELSVSQLVIPPRKVIMAPISRTAVVEDEQETSIQIPVNKQNQTMVAQTFGQKRKSYLSHNLNYQQQALTARVRMKSDASENQIITITTEHSNEADIEPAIRSAKNHSKKFNLLSNHQIMHSNLKDLLDLIDNNKEINRMKIRQLVDQINVEWRTKAEGYFDQLICLQSKLKTKDSAFFKSIFYEINMIVSEMAKKNTGIFENFPIREQRYSSTFRQTMKNRPLLLQTNKPSQGSLSPAKLGDFDHNLKIQRFLMGNKNDSKPPIQKRDEKTDSGVTIRDERQEFPQSNQILNKF